MATVLVTEKKLGRLNLNADNVEFLRKANAENGVRFLIYLHSGKVLDVDSVSYQHVSAVFGSERWNRQGG